MPTSDPRFDVWDVVKVPFPYTARPIQQHRPALVVADGLPVGAPFVLWVLMITSATNRPWGGDARISDLTVAGLAAPSVVRTDKIATIEIADAQWIGRLASLDRDDVRKKLGWFFQGLL